MSAERVRSYLIEHGVRYETHTHPTAFTSSEVAEAEHRPGAEMAKVVMLMVEDRPVMAVVPGNRMVDLEKAAATLDFEDVRLADEREFSPAFPDCEVGAEPPFGALYEIPTVVDSSLEGPRITFNAGTHEESITMDLADYLELTKPKRADLVIGS
jgi:Ala-tRNA(Pro) deacylase